MSSNQEPRMTLEEAFDAAIIALRAQGLAPSDFGLLIRDRMLRGEINATEAIRLIKEHHRPCVHVPVNA